MRYRLRTRWRPLARTKRHSRRIANLQRGGPRRKPKRRFVLVCEGSKTEPSYFRALEAAFSNTLVSLRIVEGVGVPVTVAEKAAEEAAKLDSVPAERRDSFSERDQVWAVFDVDDHPRLDEAVAICDKHQVRVGRSNPCFELWLILHEEDYDRPSTCRELQTKLHALHPEYHRKRSKTVVFEELLVRVEAAQERATSQLQRREEEGDRYGNPSTTVSCLARALREADLSARR